MQLTRAADYAVRVTMYLAARPAGECVSRSVLAEANGVPESFLSKILQALSRAGLVLSRRGLEGGFALLPRGRQASLLEVIEAVDGPIVLNLCLASSPGCENRSWCPAHLVWEEAQKAMLRVLRGAKIAALARRVPPADPAGKTPAAVTLPPRRRSTRSLALLQTQTTRLPEAPGSPQQTRQRGSRHGPKIR